MAINEKTATEDVSDTVIYVAARVAAKKKVKDLAPDVAAVGAEFDGCENNRRAAAITVIKLNAERDGRRDDVEELFEPLDLKTAAHFDGRHHPEYVRLMADTPSTLAGLKEADFAPRVQRMLDRFGDAKTDPVVTALAAGVVAALPQYVLARDNATKADVALSDRRKELHVCKGKVLEQLAKTRGLLDAAFPRKKKKVAKFFPKTKTAKAAAKMQELPHP